MFVRMRKNPLAYGITIADVERDPTLYQWRYMKGVGIVGGEGRRKSSSSSM